MRPEELRGKLTNTEQLGRTLRQNNGVLYAVKNLEESLVSVEDWSKTINLVWTSVYNTYIDRRLSPIQLFIYRVYRNINLIIIQHLIIKSNQRSDWQQ